MVPRIAAALLALCAGSALAETPKVVTDIAPVHALAARVMEGVGTPNLLLTPGQSPHTATLRPSQAQALQDASLVVWIGPELTPWLEKPLETLAGDAMHLGLLAAEGTALLSYRDPGEEEDANHDGHDNHDEHDHAGTDPHAWLDPGNAARWLVTISEALAELDPDHAAQYRSNASEGVAELVSLAAELDAGLAPVRGRPVATFHDGFQYFEARFGLVSIGTLTLGDAATPSPARVAHLREALAGEGVACVFAEPQFDERLIRSAAEGLPLSVAVLDPLGAALEPGPALYPALMRAMADAVEACLTGR